MRKTIFGISVGILLLMLVIPAASYSTSNIEVEIFAGTNFKNIGTGVGFFVDNDGTQDETVTFTCDMIYNTYTKTITLDVIVHPGEEFIGNFGIYGGIKRISVTAQAGDYSVTRSGYSIGQLIIFTS